MKDTPTPDLLFKNYLHEKGLRNTPQRQCILDIFLHEGGHLTIEEILSCVHEKDPSIGQATVYRTLKLMCNAGLAREVRFEDGFARYEAPGEAHHDHLICERCNRTIEVFDPAIERLQENLARRHQFTLTSHRMILFGLCEECRKRSATNTTSGSSKR